MYNLTLYSTAHCHLCDEAIELINIVLISELNENNYHFRIIDICDDDASYALYAIEIPVLKINFNTDKDIILKWPFNKEAVLHALFIT